MGLLVVVVIEESVSIVSFSPHKGQVAMDDLPRRNPPLQSPPSTSSPDLPPSRPCTLRIALDNNDHHSIKPTELPAGRETATSEQTPGASTTP